MGKIYYFTPYALDKNLGAAYNHYMNLLPREEDYACFLDSDTMFLMPDFGHQIQSVIDKHPEAGIFTCLTNRVGMPGQCYQNKISENSDMIHHKRIAKVLHDKYYDKIIRVKKPISGLMMIIQKKVWRESKFANGLLGVDNLISERIIKKGMPIYVMRGVYLLHYYRLVEGIKYKQHLL